MTQERMWQPTLASLFDCWQQFSLLDLHPDELVHRILEVAAQATESSRASLMLLEEDEQVLVIKAAVGLPSEVVATSRVRPGEGIAGWVAQSRRPLLLPDESDVPASVQEAMVREEIASALCVPLEVEERVLGVLNLARQGDGAPFTQRDLWFASLVADRAAMALHSARLYSQLESRERFITRILDSIPISLVVIDRTLRVVSVNRNFLQKTRRQAPATLGRKIEEIFPQVLVESTRLEQKVRQVFHTGQSGEGAKVAFRAPGLPTRTYYYRLIPLKLALSRVEGAEEAVENVMLLMDDITDREQLGEEVRRAERHLASVVECASDLVISMDPQGHIVTWNRAAERASGLTAEQVKAQSLFALCAAEQRPVMAEMLQGLARGEGVQNTEVNLLTANGQQEVPIAWSCSSMRDDAGRVVGIVAVGRDLTERRRLEAQLIQSAKIASLGVMAGGIAHELRNPLGIISASGQLLLERADDAQLRSECAQKIDAATQRASLIIENLLKFARPLGERMKEIDVHAVLGETLALLAHQMTLQKVTLRKELQPDLPWVYGNPELIQQVFTNLILNACNAMPQGGTLTLATRATEAGQASSRGGSTELAEVSARGVEIQFSDSGRGIPPEDLSKIFDPFFTTMPVGKGTGLGLSISYSIIQQHEGTIEVESQVGQGTTFTVQLPVNGR
ncbi:MAG: PAS domain S-box protein [Anaerolineae bacterium]